MQLKQTASYASVLAFGFGLLFSSPLLAQFSGDYDVANWNEIRQGEPPAGGGEVDTSAAPTSILLMGGDDSCDDLVQPQSLGLTRAESLQRGADVPCMLLFAVTITGTGNLTFQWDYETEDGDGPEYDLFGYALNGVFTQLSDDSGADVQSGTENLNVSAGDEFSFYIDCTDCEEGPANALISQFSAPAGTAPPAPLAVPVNSLAGLSLLVLLLVGLGVWAIRSGR